jgi:hypothetical protein
MATDHAHGVVASHEPDGGETVPGPLPTGRSRRLGVLGLLIIGPSVLGADLATIFVPEPLLAVVAATGCVFVAFTVIVLAALVSGGRTPITQTMTIRSVDALSPAAPFAVAIAFAPIGLMGRGLPHVWMLWAALIALVTCGVGLLMRRRRLTVPSRVVGASTTRGSIDS